MTEAVVASRKPYFVELKAGRRYAWCACGRSRRQPWCDGSHAGTGTEPVQFVADADREAVLCGCKRTGGAPYCDGTHNALSDRYQQAAEDEVSASAMILATPRSEGLVGKSNLDGGCYVATVAALALQPHGTLRLGAVISPRDGARFLSQWYVLAAPGLSGVLQFPGSDTVIFKPAGATTINISGRHFGAVDECGILVRNGEAFQIDNTGGVPQPLLLTVCPGCEVPRWLDSMPESFDEKTPERVFGVDRSKHEPMADRFYQVLNGQQNGSTEITQFIGEIPRSRAAAHRHLYEEAIMILSGEGYMWTERARAAVGPGDIIFLPRKQLHSLECTAESGMRLVGAFYPSGSPAVNY